MKEGLKEKREHNWKEIATERDGKYSQNNGPKKTVNAVLIYSKFAI